MQTQASTPAPAGRAWAVFALVFALMVVDYVDRQVVVSMFPHLKTEWGLSDAQLGSLASVVSIMVATGAVPLSLLADRWSRVKSIFLMAIVWSAATIACAYAGSYGELLAARGVVGVGEAAYGAVGAALLSGLFPARMRSTILGSFIAAALVGSVVGVVVGGAIAERWGWRAGFGAVGVPGLLLALLFAMVARDYRTVALPVQHDGERANGVRAVIEALLRPRTALVACIGSGLHLLMVSATWTWMPTYLTRHYGLPADQAGIRAGFVVLLGGIASVVWSVVADRLSARYVRARLYVSAALTLLTAVWMSVTFGLVSAGNLQFALIVAGAALMTGSLGPIAAVVVDVVHPGVRATASAILAVTQNLFGLAAGPLVAGLMSDRYGLPFALSIVPVFSALAGGVYLLAARTYAADLRNAEGAEVPYDGDTETAIR